MAQALRNGAEISVPFQAVLCVQTSVLLTHERGDNVRWTFRRSEPEQVSRRSLMICSGIIGCLNTNRPTNVFGINHSQSTERRHHNKNDVVMPKASQDFSLHDEIKHALRSYQTGLNETLCDGVVLELKRM